MRLRKPGKPADMKKKEEAYQLFKKQWLWKDIAHEMGWKSAALARWHVEYYITHMAKNGQGGEQPQ